MTSLARTPSFVVGGPADGLSVIEEPAGLRDIEDVLPAISTHVSSSPFRTIRTARIERALSRERLAAAAGISARTVYNLEHGVGNPRDLTRSALARALGLPEAQLLFNWRDPRPGSDSRTYEKHEAPAGTARASQKTGGDGASEPPE
jgi:transcriptional regulator with XRE-family HTH domain